MIYIDRSKQKIPHVLRPGGPGEEETNKAIQHFCHGNPAKPEFTVYAHASVKKALLELFHGKCAYCESLCASVEDVDVEHYRPKGAIHHSSGDRQVPGYYWLAATWDNLFPSCTRCNQIRYTELSDGSVVRSGKGNAFPLKDDQKRATAPSDELRREEPMLLNPCEHDPKYHVRFNHDGTVSPLTREGDESIKTYGLQRKWLADARNQRALLILSTIREIRIQLGLIQVLRGAGADYRPALHDVIVSVQRLVRFTGDAQQYAALSRALIYPFRSEALDLVKTEMAKRA